MITKHAAMAPTTDNISDANKTNRGPSCLFPDCSREYQIGAIMFLSPSPLLAPGLIHPFIPVPRQFVYGHFVYDTSSTDISSADISSTIVCQRYTSNFCFSKSLF